MEDLFEFNNAYRGATHQSYDWSGTLSKLVYRLEMLGGLVFLCCLVYCVPIAAEFFRRFSAFVTAPPFVFVFFNAVIVVIALSVKFGVFSAGTDSTVSSKENACTDEEEVQQQLVLLRNRDDPGKSFFQGLHNVNNVDESLTEKVVVEDKEVILCEDKTIHTPTTTTTTRSTPILMTHVDTHVVSQDDEYEYYEDENPVLDELSCEEFNKKIENFIEDMRTFRRQEYWLESLKENNRTSIAVFD